MSTTITPTPGRIVWYRGADGKIRAAIVTAVSGDFCLNLHVFGQTGADPEQGYKDSVTHADPEQEPGCFPSWHWMPYQKQQAEKHAKEVAAGGQPTLASSLPPHQQRVVEEKRDLDEKLAKLGAFFDTPIFAGLDEGEKGRLELQEEVMTKYSVILGQRISAFRAAASSTV